MTDATRPLVISAPEPRTLDLIFTADKLADLRTRYDVFETDADSVAGLEDALLARAVYVLGQPPIPSDTLAKMTALKAVLNVESNLMDNMPYGEIFARGIHVVTTCAVFAVSEDVAAITSSDPTPQGTADNVWGTATQNPSRSPLEMCSPVSSTSLPQTSSPCSDSGKFTPSLNAFFRVDTGAHLPRAIPPGSTSTSSTFSIAG